MLIVAHRGYSSRFPENTCLAFDRAISAGADLIETDLRLTRDGTVVCSHDADLRRVSGTPLAIADGTLDQVKAVTLTHGQQVPTLAEALAIARGRSRVMLDVKVDSDRLRAAILETLRDAGMRDQAVYGVRGVQSLQALRGHAAGLALIAMPPRPEQLASFLGPGVRAARLWEEDATAAAVAHVRSAGLEVWVTAGLRPEGEAPGHITAARLDVLLALGVDAVLVNDVALALQARAAHQPTT